MTKTLTATIIFEAGSLNYGEGTGNISELKKFNRADGNTYTFTSRQALRYDVVRLGNEWFGWNLDTVDKAKGTLQFKDGISIRDSIEMDLFGYLKTGKKSLKRPATVRLSHAISLEPYTGDMEFLNNMGLAERLQETPNLANIENHISYYVYTLTVDLDQVGKDRNDDTELENEEKFKRMQQFLEILKLLSRNIRGRQENLAPLFIIGGVYDMANPFFQGRISMNEKALEVTPLLETMKTTFRGRSVYDNTVVGLSSGSFSNEQEIRESFGEQAEDVESAFRKLTGRIAEHYGVNADAIASN